LLLQAFFSLRHKICCGWTMNEFDRLSQIDDILREKD
jgi:hypothetical protein